MGGAIRPLCVLCERLRVCGLLRHRLCVRTSLVVVGFVRSTN